MACGIRLRYKWNMNGQTRALRFKQISPLIRPAGWTFSALMLLFPLIAMQFEQRLHWGVNWTAGDFLGAALLLGSAGAALEMAVRLSGNISFRAGAFLGIGGALVMVWANLAVGLAGPEGSAANVWFMTVPLAGLAVAAAGRFSAKALVRAMLTMAVVQGLVGLIAGGGSETVAVTFAFGSCWLASAWLFARAV